MTQVADPTIATSRELAADTAYRLTTDRRRWLQLALAAVWVFDGLLQYQTFMFTEGFSQMFIRVHGDGNPRWVSASIHWAWSIVETNPVLINAGFATLQLGLGLAIAWRKSLKVALVVSIIWSLIVWWFAEDLGGLLSGGANALSGAPGAVLLYAVLAVLLWPVKSNRDEPFVASRPVGTAPAKVVWLVLWLGFAVLNLLPANLTPNAVHDTVVGMGDGQPVWVKGLIDGFADVSAHDGAAFSIAGAIVMALVGLGILLPAKWTKVTIILALVVSAFIWVIGQALGAVAGGQSTDVNSGPLLAIIALAYWPTAPQTATSTTATENHG
jgi:hypothetical protein